MEAQPTQDGLATNCPAFTCVLPGTPRVLGLPPPFHTGSGMHWDLRDGSEGQRKN